VPIEAVAAGGGVVVDADGNSLIDLGSASPSRASATPTRASRPCRPPSRR
jgi:hypothetical protein